MNIERFKKRLEDKERELQSEIASLEEEAREAGEGEVRDSTDDAATDQGVSESLEEEALASNTLIQVQDALKAGHTLRLIHKRLNLAGVPISYKLLSSYRGRIERRKKGPAPSASPNMPLPAGSPDRTPPAFDPLVNFRAQEQKRKDWQYPSGPPDESKLI